VKIADVTPTTENGLVSIAPGRVMRILEFPSTAVRQGKVYSAWSDGASGNPDIVLATSNDRGATWSVSSVTSSVDGDYQPNLPQFDPVIAPAYMGDYISVASDGKTVYAAWGDNRDTVVSPLWENGRPDPDVFFAKTWRVTAVVNPLSAPRECVYGMVSLRQHCLDQVLGVAELL
jgi:hypothetical protein